MIVIIFKNEIMLYYDTFYSSVTTHILSSVFLSITNIAISKKKGKKSMLGIE